MRAMQVSEFGPPDVLRLVDLADPVPGPDDVVVDHDHVGVNFVDTQHRAGSPYPVEVPLVVGIEAAGRISAVGSGVTGFQVGDRVAYGGTMVGVYAERAAVPAEQLVPLPDSIDTVTAAGVLLQGWTAHMLVEVAEGDDRAPGTATVLAAAGGTGSLVVQLLVARGWRVLGVASGAEKCAFVRSLGAAPIDRSAGDVVTAVLDHAERGVDVVFDGVGGSAFDQARRMLRPMGHLIAFGQSAGPVPPFDPAVLSGIHPVGGPGSLTLTWPTLNDHNASPERRRRRAAEVFELVDRGVLRPRIDATLGLSEAAEAHRRLEQGQVLGKLVLDVRR